MANSLLPPNATSFERALEGAIARLSDINVPIAPLMDPASVPIDVLPWLAWGFSVDTWDADWSDADKRTAVAESIALHRRKGTRRSVEAVLARFDQLAQLVEWHETTPRGTPHTFDIVIPMVTGAGIAAGGRRSRAAFAEAIIREIGRVKPLREHLTLIQSIVARGAVGILGIARPATFQRETLTLTADLSPDWASYLQTEDGEPIEAGDGTFLDTTP